MVKVVGITGGIGSGKTTVCKWFEAQSIPVYYADAQAKWLMNHNAELIQKIKMHFGEDVYENNTLNRTKLANLVFRDNVKLNLLNKLVHPAVFAHFEEWKAQHAHLDFVLKEAALMYESQSYLQVDAVIVVYAPISVRLERVCRRDNVSSEDVLVRAEKQLSDDYKLHKADYVIYNDGVHDLNSQLEAAQKWIKRVVS
ncbi:MAG: dephospho-CoA kinase [Bacteroidia bacterium]|nr:dephospho-CoA kinase [Bacteroidia bacterium]